MVGRAVRSMLQHRAVILVLLVGFAWRLWLSPATGYHGDVWAFQTWAKGAVELGVARSYVETVDGAMLPNYPPLSILLLGATGWFYRLFAASFDTQVVAWRVVIKLPSILADLAMAALVYRILLRNGIKRPWLGAAIYLAHPATFYDTAVWGQMDALYTAFAFAGLVAFVERRFALFGALVTCAALTKAQTIVVIPLALALILAAGVRPLLRAAAASVAVLAGVLAPFAWGGVLASAKNAYTGSVGFYPTLSSSGYNLWWALWGFDANRVNDATRGWLHATAREQGWALWGLCVAYVLVVVLRHVRARREFDGTLVFFAASMCAYSFFIFNTEMHERYLFPLVPLGLPVAAAWPRFRGPYAAATLLYFVNMLGVLRWTDVDRAIFDSFPTLTVFIATLQTACFVVSLRRFSEYASLSPRTSAEPAAFHPGLTAPGASA